jgi:hypothetical protein
MRPEYGRVRVRQNSRTRGYCVNPMRLLASVVVTVAVFCTLALPTVLGRQAVTAGASTRSFLVFSYNTSGVQLDGVPLIMGSASHHVFASQTKTVSALESRLGAAKLFTSTICSFKLPVTVATWGGLSIVFQKGTFATLDYNFRGWSVSQRTHLPLPPLGVKLTPLIKTAQGVTVGDTVTTVKSLEPRARVVDNSFIPLGIFAQLVLTRRVNAGTSNSALTVSQISAADGNC